MRAGRRGVVRQEQYIYRKYIYVYIIYYMYILYIHIYEYRPAGCCEADGTCINVYISCVYIYMRAGRRGVARPMERILLRGHSKRALLDAGFFIYFFFLVEACAVENKRFS
jgi:hypothetical protein